MPRDYANRRTSTRRRNSSSTMLWLMAILSVVLFIAGLGYLRNHPKTERPTPVEENAIKKNKAPAKEVVHEKKAPEERKVQFDFYTILPNTPNAKPAEPPKKEIETKIVSKPETLHKPIEDSEKMTLSGKMQPVVNPISTTKAVTPPKTQIKSVPAHIPLSITKKPAVPKNTYILQIAAFQRIEDANQLKSQLHLLGFDAKITKVMTKNMAWQRVWIGPYATLPLAQKAQQKLQISHVRSIITQSK